MRVLVTYGSKRGGTAGLARTVGSSLEAHGVQAEVHPASEVRAIDGYDAVVVGGALYANRWHKDARRFVKRHTKALRTVPVWLFSSGPLDGSATESRIPPTNQVAKLMDRIGAEGHMTFGGRLEPDAAGFPASAMARDHAGDWRDPDHVEAWVSSVVAVLAPVTPRLRAA